jgi:hypothetical protein
MRQLVNHFEASGGRCTRGVEPCPRIDCRYHIHGDARPSQVDAAPVPATTCSIKIADRGGMTLEAVGEILGMTRERVRQIEVSARAKLQRRLSKLGYSLGDLAVDVGSAPLPFRGKFT